MLAKHHETYGCEIDLQKTNMMDMSLNRKERPIFSKKQNFYIIKECTLFPNVYKNLTSFELI